MLAWVVMNRQQPRPARKSPPKHPRFPPAPLPILLLPSPRPPKHHTLTLPHTPLKTLSPPSPLPAHTPPRSPTSPSPLPAYQSPPQKAVSLSVSPTRPPTTSTSSPTPPSPAHPKKPRA